MMFSGSSMRFNGRKRESESSNVPSSVAGTIGVDGGKEDDGGVGGTGGAEDESAGAELGP